MARYIRFSPKFWKNKRVRSLSEDARMLYAYLITCPHGNCMGMFSLPAAYGADDLQWLPERFAKGFAELFREGFVNHDPATDLVLVVKFLEHTPLENGNQVTGALTQLAELPTSSLWKNLYDILEPLGKPFLKPLLEALSKPFGKGFAEPLPEGYAKQVTVTVPVTVSVSETVTEGGAGETASSDGGENSDTPKKPKVEKFPPESLPITLSKYLFGKILLHKPDFKLPNLQAWAGEMDLLIRVDKRDVGKVRDVIDWCQVDDFWRGNILSPKKLRQQFDQLEIKMKNDGGHSHAKTGQQYRPSEVDWSKEPATIL